MVAVGRALIGGRKLLLVDEITQGLAPNIAADLGHTLRRLADEGLGVLLVEQNSQMALELADRVYVVDQGVIVHSGDAPELRADRALMEKYLTV
jgi:branched-chain amino acid transport system ATP-binding protein